MTKNQKRRNQLIQTHIEALRDARIKGHKTMASHLASTLGYMFKNRHQRKAA